MKEELLQAIYEAKGELIKIFGGLRNTILGIKDTKDLLNIPAWLKSRLKDENGYVEFREAGYGDRILVIYLEDPWTGDNINKKQRRTAFVIYFSYQTSKPISRSQLRWKLNQIYKVVNGLRAKGYHVFPGIFAYAFSDLAVKELEKHRVRVFTTSEQLKQWIYEKVLARLKKLVEVAKFTFQFDKIFIFLKRIIESLGYEIPEDVLESWTLKPKYPSSGR